MDIMEPSLQTSVLIHTHTGDLPPTILPSFSAETRRQAEKRASPPHVTGRKRKQG